MIRDDMAKSEADKKAKATEMKPVYDAMLACAANLLAEVNALLPPIIEQAKESKTQKDLESKAAKKES